MEEPIHDGGCLCGKVRYRTRGHPASTNACHCTFCQRFTGTAFFVEPVFNKEQVEILQGELKTYEHRSDESGQSVWLHFCPNCGTTVTLTFGRFPARQGISGGTYDNPNWFQVTRHIFTRSMRNDSALPPGVDLFERHAVKPDGFPETPRRSEP